MQTGPYLSTLGARLTCGRSEVPASAASLGRVNESPLADASGSDLAPPTAASVNHEPSPQSNDAQAVTSPEQLTSRDDVDPAADERAGTDAPDGATPIDLDAIERDLTDVQTALERLNDGSYWTDEVTGEPIADDVLAAHPTARTATPTLG